MSSLSDTEQQSRFEPSAYDKATAGSIAAPSPPSSALRANSTPPGNSTTGAKSEAAVHRESNASVFGTASSLQKSSQVFGSCSFGSQPAQAFDSGFMSSCHATSNLSGVTTSAPLFQKPGVSVRRNSNTAPSYGNSWVTVLVGPAESPTSFSLYEQLARRESSFIDAALCVESATSSDVGGLGPKSAKKGDISETHDREWDRLAHAWALGAFLQAPDFRDAVTDAIIEKISSTYNYAQTMHQVIYPSTISGAPIRQLLVDLANWRWDETTLKAQKHDVAWSEFFYELSIGIMSARKNSGLAAKSGSPPWILSPCRYHEHKNADGVCYKSRRM